MQTQRKRENWIKAGRVDVYKRVEVREGTTVVRHGRFDPCMFRILSAFPTHIEEGDVSPATQRVALDSYWRAVSCFLGQAYNKTKETVSTDNG